MVLPEIVAFQHASAEVGYDRVLLFSGVCLHNAFRRKCEAGPSYPPAADRACSAGRGHLESKAMKWRAYRITTFRQRVGTPGSWNRKIADGSLGWELVMLTASHPRARQ